MKIQVVKCSDEDAWYKDYDFPIKTRVDSLNGELARDLNNDLFYHSSDCINDEDYLIDDFKITNPDAFLEDKLNRNNLIENVLNQATKFDDGKPSFSSIPQLALLEVAKGFTHGREKYGLFNYSSKMELLRYIDALDRHKNQFLTFKDENDIDDSGVHHLALIACNALMALDSILTGNSIDNRNKIYNKK